MATAITAYPFDAGTGANVTEVQWSAMLRRLLGSGVLATASASTGFAVSERAAGANMSVDVAAGDAFVRGHYMTSAATVNLAVTTADGSHPRIDRVVLRLDWSNNAGYLDVVAGTAAAVPAATALVQSSSVWEMSLATVSVPASDTTIGTAQITDDRYYAWPYRDRRVFTFTVPGLIAAADEVVPFFVPVLPGMAASIVGARHMVRTATTATWTLKQNAGAITGLTSIASSTTATTTSLATAVALANGDKVTLDVTAIDGTPADLTVSVYVDYSPAG